MKLSNEVKTGILAIATIACLVVGYNFLKGKNVFKKERVFYAVYDNVEGLGPSSAVTINGLKVGVVQDISFTDTEGKLKVKFSVEKDFSFSKNSIARVYGGGIIGGKSVAVIPVFDDAPPAENGDTLRGEVEEGIMELVNEKLAPLQQKIESTFEGTDSLLTSLNSMLDTDTRLNVQQAIAGLNATITDFQSFAAGLNQNSGKIDNSLKNIERASENFAVLSDSLSQIELGRLVSDLETTLAGFRELSDKLNSNEGSIGKLLHDEQLYNNLEGATHQLEQLLQDMKLNPKRYVHFSLFGKKGAEYNPPDDREM